MSGYKYLKVPDYEYFGECDECRGIHNIIDLHFVKDTITLCCICYDRITSRQQIKS